MTDTRKQIIEIIEPYMDKTLSEGCFIEIRKPTNLERQWRYGPMQIIGKNYFGYYCKDFSKFPKDVWFSDDFGRQEKNISKYFYDEIREGINGERQLISQGVKDGRVKVIGHYDITSVLKYIDETGFGHIFTQKEIFTDEIRVFTEDQYEGGKVTEFGDNLGWLPCKPLHLFTDQEDKDLLTLLQKIGN